MILVVHHLLFIVYPVPFMLPSMMLLLLFLLLLLRRRRLYGGGGSDDGEPPRMRGDGGGHVTFRAAADSDVVSGRDGCLWTTRCLFRMRTGVTQTHAQPVIHKLHAFSAQDGRIERRQSQRRHAADGVFEMRFLLLEFPAELLRQQVDDELAKGQEELGAPSQPEEQVGHHVEEKQTVVEDELGRRDAGRQNYVGAVAC